MKKLHDVGFISKTAGFNGEVVLATDGMALADGTRFLFFMFEGKPVPFLITDSRTRDGQQIIKFEDVDDEAAAKKLSGLRVYAESAGAGEQGDELSWFDLTGYEVVEEQAGSLGPLLSVEEYPGQLLGRCMVKGKEVLFPLLDEFVVAIDEEKRILRLHLPEGLLSVYL